MILRELQALLARLYDAPVEHDVENFLVRDRRRLAELAGDGAQGETDEQVFVVEDGRNVHIGLFVAPEVIGRLEQSDPLGRLDDDNLPDYCTALEGVSHFHYLMWNLSRGRNVSLLELELQADVDKYASALTLITQQRNGLFPASLHTRLFHRVRYLPELSADSRRRYEEANRHAARFCRSLQERFLGRRSRPEAFVSELRRFFRCGHQEKLRRAC
jgi:hypothetical protein